MNNEACKAIEAKLPTLLPDLLLDPAAVPASVQQHMASCKECRTVVDQELAAHRATFELLESWAAPEVSPYFGSRMSALLREAQQSPRTSLVERLRSWMLLSNLHIKPMAGAAALGLLLAIGGGAYVDLTQNQPTPAPVPQASATVRDLQSLNDNAQVFQQMSSLDSGDNDGGNSL
jgi:predicted anti-sigma-YlaC factor YlaD